VLSALKLSLLNLGEIRSKCERVRSVLGLRRYNVKGSGAGMASLNVRMFAARASRKEAAFSYENNMYSLGKNKLTYEDKRLDCGSKRLYCGNESPTHRNKWPTCGNKKCPYP